MSRFAPAILFAIAIVLAFVGSTLVSVAAARASDHAHDRLACGASMSTVCAAHCVDARVGVDRADR